MTPEAKTTAAIIKHLKQLQKQGEPLFFWKVHGSNYQQAGLPDLVLCYRGQFLGLEVKAQAGVVAPLQANTHAKIIAAGGRCAVVRSVEDVVTVLATRDPATAVA